MDKSELKKIAIDSLSAAGTLLRQEKYREARKMAEQAWNAYFTLQRNRDDDEDYTDLIYYARGLYMDADNNLSLQQEEDEDDDEFYDDEVDDDELPDDDGRFDAWA